MIQKWKKLKKNEKGLTLIELLAVLVILGIIAAIAIPLIGNVINNSKDRAILADASNIIAGAKLAHANGGNPPFGPDDLKGFVDGIDLNSFTDNTLQVKYDSTNGWSILFSKFANIKDKNIQDEIGDDNEIDEKTLNKLLRKE